MLFQIDHLNIVRSYCYRWGKIFDLLFRSVRQLYEAPCVVTMIVAATRMHRYLIDSAFKPDLYVISSLSFAYPLNGDRCHFREHKNPQVSKLVFARTKQTDTTPITPNRIEVTVHPAFEQYLTPRKSDDYSSEMSTNEKGSPTSPTGDDDSSSTIMGTSEHMSRIVGDPSKSDPSQTFTHPLPIVSPSPQTQSV